TTFETAFPRRAGSVLSCLRDSVLVFSVPIEYLIRHPCIGTSRSSCSAALEADKGIRLPLRLSLLMKSVFLILLVAIVTNFSLRASDDERGAEVPDGLASSDWSSIREAYDAGRHAIQQQGDSTHTARNPGQQWTTDFDGRGFLIRPDHGERK